MSYLNDVFYVNPNTKMLYKMTNDAIATGYPIGTNTKPQSVLVATDMSRVFVVNYGSNSVSIYKNGVLQRSVNVGARPVGICESHKGDFYVTNFSSNTVTKIDGATYSTTTIGVGKSPRGICCSSDGNIYVANYANGTVTKITNDIVVSTITVGRGPSGICCDRNGAVWVTNVGSHTVTKIDKLGRVAATIQLTSGSPYGICCDINGNKWVTGYTSNMVYKLVGTAVSSKIAVGSRPSAVATNEKGHVYVFNSQDGTITKIVNNTVADTINAQTSNISADFGDPTGFQSYYIHKYIPSSTPSGSTIADGSISFSKLDQNLQDMVNAGAANADNTKYLSFVLADANKEGPSNVEHIVPFKGNLEEISMSIPVGSTVTDPIKVGIEYFMSGKWNEFDEIEIGPSDGVIVKAIDPVDKVVLPNTIIRCNMKTVQEDIKNINVILKIKPNKS